MTILGRGSRIDRLRVYNGALLLCGERSLVSVDENCEARRICDEAWDQNTVRWCLEIGQWDFATRTVRLDYDPSVTPDFGYRFAFDQPDDFVSTIALATDEMFSDPLNRYAFENGFWFCDYDQIYLRYVSDDDAYGYDFSLWTETFMSFVQAAFAQLIVPRLTQQEKRVAYVERAYKQALIQAKNQDRRNKPTQFPPVGNWTAARLRGKGTGGRADGGTRSRLTG